MTMQGDPDSRAIGFVLVIIAAPVVIVTLLAHATFGATPTVCLGLLALGIASLTSEDRDSTGLPRARARLRKR